MYAFNIIMCLCDHKNKTTGKNPILPCFPCTVEIRIAYFQFLMYKVTLRVKVGVIDRKTNSLVLMINLLTVSDLTKCASL